MRYIKITNMQRATETLLHAIHVTTSRETRKIYISIQKNGWDKHHLTFKTIIIMVIIVIVIIIIIIIISTVPYSPEFRGTGGRSYHCSENEKLNKQSLILDIITNRDTHEN